MTTYQLSNDGFNLFSIFFTALTGTHLEDLQLQSKCHKMLNCRSSYSYLFSTLQVSVRRGMCYERPKNALVEGFSAFIGLGILFYYSPARHKSLIRDECQRPLSWPIQNLCWPCFAFIKDWRVVKVLMGYCPSLTPLEEMNRAAVNSPRTWALTQFEIICS